MAIETSEDLTRQIVGHMAFVFLLGSVCAYMLYHSEREAKRWLVINKAWSPDKPIADEPAELARLRQRLVLFYGGILALCLVLFLLSAKMLWDRSQQEAQGVVTEEARPDGHTAEATAPASTPGGNEQAAHPATSETSPPDQAPTRPASQSPPRQQTRTGQGEPTMVLVPGGTFWMGINDDEMDRVIEDCKTELKKDATTCKGWALSAQPRHQVTLDPFFLDPYEVTNQQFEQFVQATGYQTTAEKKGTAEVWIDGQGWQETKEATWRRPEAGPDVFASDRADHPVVNVSWHDAEAYCRWVGKRLPTEAEFEYATRAGTQTTYWWGNFSPGTRQVVNVADESAKTHLPVIVAGYDDGYLTTAPVGSYEANPYGLFDMTGNVTEWTADWSDGFYYRKSPDRNPTGPSSGEHRIIRGGGWNDASYRIRPTVRIGWLPTDRNTKTGFRCAKNQLTQTGAMGPPQERVGSQREEQRDGSLGFFEWVAEHIPLWIAGFVALLVPVWFWRLSEQDKHTRAEVEWTRDKWEATSTYEREYQKVHARGRRTTWTFLAIYVLVALVIVCAHVVVRS